MKEFFVKLWNSIKTNWKFIIIGAIIVALYGLVLGLMQMTFTSIVIFANVSTLLTIVLGVWYAKVASPEFKLVKFWWTILIPLLLDIFLLLKFIF